jgi:[protein-PII] uridylyltransferase
MRPVVIRCRERLREGREKARQQHESGSPGVQVSTRLADLYDDVVLDVWQEATREHVTDPRLGELCLVAHGGFGRRDLAPFSDADLMLLAARNSESLAQKIAGDLTRDLVDIGIQPGFSLRDEREACQLAWGDPIVFSSLTESRLLAGSLQLYSKFFHRLRRGAMRRRHRLIRSVVAARRQERRKWGETNYLLRPNIKRSRGSLRDIQLIRWIGFARYGETDLERLVKLCVLPEEDYRQLRRAYAFMLRLRNELHFREGKGQDILDRPTQMEIAESWGYEGTEGVLPVERFMQDYFDNTRNVRYAAAYFADDARSRPLWGQVVERVFSRQIDHHIRMGPTHIWVPASELDRFAVSLPDVLRLMSLANEHRRRISHRTWQAIRQAMQERQPTPPDEESIEAFLSLLSRPGRLAPLLRRLHELRVIEQLIPEFGHTRGLLQFNAYHKYTVDAHSFRAVEAATDLQTETSGMGRRYRRLDDKRLLHLALLIHDIGKGYDEEHCIVGARIAKLTAERLKLKPADAENLEWLVLKHLAVNVVAFRHDLSDPEIVLSFAAEVGSIRRLELLVVHSVADLVAVGPGVATDWKMNLIEDLYKRTRRYFDSGDLPGSPDDPEIESTREAIRKELTERSASQACYDLLGQFPLSLLSRGDPARLSEEICCATDRLVAGETTVCTCHDDVVFKAMRYTVIHRENEESIGTFARATGALSTLGLVILRAQIETIGNELAWDHFWVTDPECPDGPVQGRIDQVCERVKHLLDTPSESLPAYRRTWAADNKREPAQVNVLPRKVVFDNETVDRYTIVSLFAYDEVGLLYRIATALAEQRVVLHFAKIDTHLDQVADVFYVSEPDGSKLLDGQRQHQVREALLSSISSPLGERSG